MKIPWPSLHSQSCFDILGEFVPSNRRSLPLGGQDRYPPWHVDIVHQVGQVKWRSQGTAWAKAWMCEIESLWHKMGPHGTSRRHVNMWDNNVRIHSLCLWLWAWAQEILELSSRCISLRTLPVYLISWQRTKQSMELMCKIWDILLYQEICCCLSKNSNVTGS